MTDLLCTVYKGKREKELYLFVERGTVLEEAIPDELLQRLGETSEVMTIRIGPEKKLARVQASQVLQEIEENGFFLQLPPDFNPHLTFGE